MSLRTLIEGFITSVATDVVKLTKFTTGSNTGTDLSALNGAISDRTSLPAAINAVLAVAQAASGLTIDDVTDSTTKTNSSSKVTAKVNAAIAAVVGVSPSALDTLQEFATALNNDPAFAATVNTALGNRLRFDAPQTLDAGQKTQGIANLGAVAAADVGDTTTSLVAVYTAAKSA